jgi:catechol 2,3-dioxygenase-like lactoylglutathione lyase family enzyme
MDMKLEVVVLPVADVDRAKQFYGSLGRREDASIIFGQRVTAAAPGPVDGRTWDEVGAAS